MPTTTPPFAPAPPKFTCPALATAAARAPLGGAREALLGALLVARLGSGLCPPHPLPVEVRRARAAGARTWLSALAVPSKTRSALQRAIAASAEDEPRAMAQALEAVTEVTAPFLDRGAGSELRRVVTALLDAQASLAAPSHTAIE